MKFTEGAFRNWCYSWPNGSLPNKCSPGSNGAHQSLAGETQANAHMQAAKDSRKVIIKDAIADITLQQV